MAKCERCQILEEQLDHKRLEAQEMEQLIGRLSTLLTMTANVLNGPPPKNGIHDWSTVPYLAMAWRGRLKRLARKSK